MDRGSILHSEMGPGVAFAIFLNFRGGGSIYHGVNLTWGVHCTQVGGGGINYGEKLTGGGPFCIVKRDRG